MGLQIRRGTDAERLTIIFAAGEPVFTTDTQKLYVGDGSTLGGVEVSEVLSDNPIFNSIYVTTTATIGTLIFSGDAQPISSRAELIGYTGSRGYSGSQGDIGYSGSFGDLGYTGSVGVTGYTGSAGTNGTNGYTGSIGSTGYTGSIGGTGFTGSFGYTGSTGGSSGRNYFFNYSRTEVGTYKELGTDPTTATQTTLTTTCAGNTSTLLASFASDPFDFTIIPGGAQNFRIHLSKAASGNDVDAYCILRLADNSGTIISTVGTTSLSLIGWNTDANTAVEVVTDIVLPTTNVSIGQRMIVEIYAIVNGATSRNIKFYTEGTAYYSYVTTSLASAPGPTGFTGSSGSLGYTGSAGSFDQTLNTTDNVVFKSAKSTQLLSSGGYPLDSNGQALIRTTNTQTPALIVSNYTSGLLPEIILRGYGQNRPGTVSGTTAANEALAMEGSRGTMTSPTALGSGDLFFSVAGGGYDGARWSSDSAFFPAGIFATSTEAMAGSASTTTNAGSRFVMRVQPQGVQLNSTSRLNFHIGSWTAASGTTPPQYAISEGSGADGTTPTLISSSGTSTWLGYGKTFRQFINSEMRIIGVPYEDSAPDNPSLINTNGISLISGRRSGVSGRRDTLQNNDTIGFIGFRGQTATNGNATGSTGSVFFASALGTWSGSNYGTRVTLTSANSGTTTITNRLKLDNVEHVYASALHSFKTANEGTTIMSLSTSSIFITAPIDSAIQRTAGGLVTGMNVGSTTYTLYSYVAATYPGAKFVIKINDGTDLHMTEMLVITDGTNTSYNEFAAITNNGDLGTFDATVSGSDVLIRFTTKVGITNASAKVTAQLMTA